MSLLRGSYLITDPSEVNAINILYPRVNCFAFGASIHVNMIMEKLCKSSHNSLEAYTITGVSTTGFTRTSDFDDLASPKSIVSCHGVGQLYSRKLGLLQPIFFKKLFFLFNSQHLVPRDQCVMRDIDE